MLLHSCPYNDDAIQLKLSLCVAKGFVCGNWNKNEHGASWKELTPKVFGDVTWELLRIGGVFQIEGCPQDSYLGARCTCKPSVFSRPLKGHACHNGRETQDTSHLHSGIQANAIQAVRMGLLDSVFLIHFAVIFCVFQWPTTGVAWLNVHIVMMRHVDRVSS